MINIAVDAMGGDHAPSAIVDGAVAAASQLDIQISLVGAPAAIEQALDRHGRPRHAAITIVDAPDVIEMTDAPSSVRRKPRASIRVAADLVARGEAQALFSAGHTGATVVATHAAFGMIAGADRAALVATIPTRGKPAVLLDAGANVECRPQHLLQFAVMGGVYAKVALGVERPRVGLLSIGEEETKGNELTREAHRLLRGVSRASEASRGAPINFIGNVEGREIYSGVADVIVCDGFTGNIVLKTSEGLVEMLTEHAVLERPQSVDYADYGGAPLLGVAGLAIVGHGRSSAKAVTSAIALAHRFVSEQFLQRVEQEIAAAHVTHH